jgi:hypothetical protein
MPPKQTLILPKTDMTKKPSPIYTYTCIYTYFSIHMYMTKEPSPVYIRIHIYIRICLYICEVEMTKSLFTSRVCVCCVCVCVCVRGMRKYMCNHMCGMRRPYWTKNLSCVHYFGCDFFSCWGWWGGGGGGGEGGGGAERSTGGFIGFVQVSLEWKIYKFFYHHRVVNNLSLHFGSDPTLLVHYSLFLSSLPTCWCGGAIGVGEGGGGEGKGVWTDRFHVGLLWLVMCTLEIDPWFFFFRRQTLTISFPDIKIVYLFIYL